MLAEPTACAAGSPTGREAVLLVMYTAAPSCPLDPSANIYALTWFSIADGEDRP